MKMILVFAIGFIVGGVVTYFVIKIWNSLSFLRTGFGG